MLGLVVLLVCVVGMVHGQAITHDPNYVVDCSAETQGVCAGKQDCCWFDPASGGGGCIQCKPIRDGQRQALAEVFATWGYATHKPDGVVGNILCPSSGVVDQHRVTCDDDGHVTDLTLSNENLYGDVSLAAKISPPIMPRIEVFAIAANYLYGTLPQEIGARQRTTQFWITHNYFRGAMPNLVLPQVREVGECQLVSKGLLKDIEQFGLDQSCFDCGGGFAALPAGCAPTTNFPNRCNLFAGNDVSQCPAAVMPDQPTPEPTDASQTGGCVGQRGCACNPNTGACAAGLVCRDNLCLQNSGARAVVDIVLLAALVLVAVLVC